MNPRSQIKLEGAGLSIGETSTIPCIFCGASHEQTLRITRTEEGLLYKCHRASCNAGGFVGTLPGADAIPTSRKKKREPETRPLGRALTHNEYMVLCRKFRLLPHEVMQEGWTITPAGRIVMPVRNVNGHEIGWNERAWPEFYKGPSTRKSLYRPGNPDCPVIHFPLLCWKHDNRDTWVVVEDQPSAMRAVPHVPCVALLGTHMGADKREELRKTGAKRVIICLDNDAAAQSVKMVRELSLYFDVVEARIPPRDLKDMENDDWILENLT